MQLIEEHVYQWGDRLFQANKGDAGWSLLYIDQRTGRPLPSAPRALNGYFLMRGTWYEAVYNAAGKRVVGNAVEIDLTQFRDIAAEAATQFVEGHIYTDGKLIYAVAKPDPPFVIMLFRVNIVEGLIVKSLVANSILGYSQDEIGNWYVFRVGNQHTERTHVTVLAPEFEGEILPKLSHVADSLQDYINNTR